jgi:hypothetical protein
MVSVTPWPFIKKEEKKSYPLALPVACGREDF